jgi:2-keto-4-pentenoate hydratase
LGAIDPLLIEALREQLAQRDALLRSGARRVGWKLGLSDRDRIGGDIGIGHLTSATCLNSGDSYPLGRGGEMTADAEIVVELARGIGPADDDGTVRQAIARYGAAVEICDIAPLADEPYSVIATNDFHRAVTFAELAPSLPDGEVELSVDGAVRASGPVPRDLPDRLRAAARVLDAVGERLRAGDRIITGLIVNASVAAGNEVVTRAGPLPPARLRIVA